MVARTVFVLIGSLALVGCSSSAGNPFLAERGVFSNPYAMLDTADSVVGPACDERIINTEGCWIGDLRYTGRGRYAYDRDGNRVRLTRGERRQLLIQYERVQARIDVLESLRTGLALPPGSPALPRAVNQAPPPQPPAPPPQSEPTGSND